MIPPQKNTTANSHAHKKDSLDGARRADNINNAGCRVFFLHSVRMMDLATFKKLADAARDANRVTGLTHNFYRYPARFSPTLAATAIRLFSKAGDLVFDPYMGGGTTIVEAMAAGRRAIGADLNSLSVFVTRVKTTPLKKSEKTAVALWADNTVPTLTYRYPAQLLTHIVHDVRTKNMQLPTSRFIRKTTAAILHSINALPTEHARDFARCAVLKTCQLAVDGRKTHTPLSVYRQWLQRNVLEMLNNIALFAAAVRATNMRCSHPTLIETDAALIDQTPTFRKSSSKIDLVVTSPPYPGLHVLYHRWQINGRRETPAPYWIAGCQDGQGDSYYNFGSRHQPGLTSYFESSLKTLTAIRKVMREGAFIVQMLAFSDPASHLPRYLANMGAAGFTEVPLSESHERIWRHVPNRKWHASLKGNTRGSREVVLVHRAL